MKKNSYSIQSIPLRTYFDYSKILKHKWFILLLLAVFTNGCKKVTETRGLIGVCPIVISTIPDNNALGVSISTNVYANFNEVMDSTTINGSTFTLKVGTTLVSGKVTFSGTTATFSPLVYLLNDTTYTATITTGAKDPAGNALVSDYVWTFRTGTTLYL